MESGERYIQKVSKMHFTYLYTYLQVETIRDNEQFEDVNNSS